MVLVIGDYLGRSNKVPDLTRLTYNRLKRYKAIRAQLLEFFENIDNCMIPSVDYEDCVKAQKGKQELRQRIQRAITTTPSTMVHQL